jgi:hypothetical protein
MAKKSIASYARLLEIQHYYRAVHHRHPKAIRLNIKTLNEVLARFLQTAKKTIPRRRLGGRNPRVGRPRRLEDG